MWERKKRTQNVVWRKVMGRENPVEIKILELKVNTSWTINLKFIFKYLGCI
jgi:hypothetical protein